MGLAPKDRTTMLTILSLLVACAPAPASIKLDGDAAVTTHSVDPMAAETATVLDEAGTKIEPQPEIVWTVTPETVAKLDAGKIVPVGNGDATVTAAVGDVKAEYKVTVALPDAVAINGYKAGDVFQVGETKALTAAVTAAGAPVDGQPMVWASDNTAVVTVDDKGTATAMSEGTANVTATSGKLVATVPVVVSAAAPATADAAVAPK
jgi:hypothetical protein